jgi:capsule polysaccharide export protein KpsE/RkpR
MRSEMLTTKNDESKQGALNWVTNASLLWAHRRILGRVGAGSLLLSIVIVLLIPKQYESTARIMPPETSGASTALLAAIAGRGELGGLSGLGGLAGSLLGARTTGPLFVDLLKSATVSNDLIDRFQLQQVYGKRYRVDTAKRLARRTSVVEDKRSGVILITVEDSDPRRARDLAQAYLDELNLLVNRTNTSSARQERIFIEHRLQGAQADLERAQRDMSEFASTHTAIDMKEQTRATVDAAAKLEGQIIFERSELDSLKQVYGDENVRIRSAQARVGELQRQLDTISGTSTPLQPDEPEKAGAAPLNRATADYPSLRQLPRLAVPYADIYRRVRVQETLFEMLTQQYELARIQEAKDVPVVRVIDLPGVPEKKSFPPRTLFCLLLTTFGIVCAAASILIRHRWRLMDSSDERKVLGIQVAMSLRDQALRARSVFSRASNA